MSGNHLSAPTTGKGPIIFCDFDGTISQVDVTDEILSELAHPSWREVEEEWLRGAIGSRECLERQMALVQASAVELDGLIDAVPVDPNFPAFLRFAEEHGIPFYVVSDGFDYVIQRVLRHAGLNGDLRNGMHLFSSSLAVKDRRLVASFPQMACGHGCATCKAEVIRRLGQGYHPVIFIGDGLSDRFAVAESDVVFAKRQLLAYCRDRSIACHHFETFADVHVGIEELPAMATPAVG